MEDTYTYNDRHELTPGKTESKISGTYHEWVGRKHGLTYDNQGNRLTHSRNRLAVRGMWTGHATTYTTNKLNPYSASPNHGHFFTWKSTKSSTGLQNVGTGAGIVKCATLRCASSEDPADLTWNGRRGGARVARFSTGYSYDSFRGPAP